MLEEKLVEYCKELERKNEELNKQMSVLIQENRRLLAKLAYLEEACATIGAIADGYQDYLVDMSNGDYDFYSDGEEDDKDDDCDEENDHSPLDSYYNPFGISMRDVFKMTESAKDLMSPAEQVMYDMMKKSLGITDEDLK